MTTETTTAEEASDSPVQKRIGDVASAGQDNCRATDTCILDFRVTKVTGCTSGGYPGDAPPAGTHRKLIWMTIKTGADYDAAELLPTDITDFVAVTADGTSTGSITPSTYWECVPDKDRLGFGDEWHPNHKYAGAVEVYLPNDAVKIADGGGQVEWTLE